MTEKRFTLDFDDPRAVWIDDNRTDKSYDVINDTIKEKNIQEIVDVLNEQHEENEQLKQRITTQSVDREQLCKRIDEVRKENEQLKQQLADVDRLIDDLGHDEMRRQYEEIFKGDVE